MKRSLIFSVVVLTGILSGCASSTKPITNKMEVTQPQVSPTLAVEPVKQLKRKVAIARFSDETKNSRSVFVDKNNDQIGKQASDILASRLTESGKFLLLERADLDKITSEQALTDIKSDIVGADYLIIGSISEFGRKTMSDTGVFSRNKIQVATATVNVRLVNTNTGQVVFSQEASGEAREEASTVIGLGKRAAYDSSLNDKAISAAISKLISNLMENLMDMPWKAYLVDKQDGLFVMTGGESQGISSGDKFSLVAKGKVIKNPQTGINIELPGKKIGEVEVIQTLGNGDNEVSLVSVSADLDAAKLSSVVVMEAE